VTRRYFLGDQLVYLVITISEPARVSLGQARCAADELIPSSPCLLKWPISRRRERGGHHVGHCCRPSSSHGPIADATVCRLVKPRPRSQVDCGSSKSRPGNIDLSRVLSAKTARVVADPAWARLVCIENDPDGARCCGARCRPAHIRSCRRQRGSDGLVLLHGSAVVAFSVDLNADMQVRSVIELCRRSAALRRCE